MLSPHKQSPGLPGLRVVRRVAETGTVLLMKTHLLEGRGRGGEGRGDEALPLARPVELPLVKSPTQLPQMARRRASQ